jgi:hypothetical protein
MSKMKVALEQGGPKRLELSWKGTWQEVKIHLDGRQIGAFTDRDHFITGQEFTLKDGSLLKIQLSGKSMFAVPRFYLDGRPLSLSGYPPQQRLKMSYQTLFMIAAVGIVFGLHGLLMDEPIGSLPKGGWPYIAGGLVFAVLGVFVMRKSIVALSIAVGIGAIDTILACFISFGIPWPLRILIIVFRLGLLFLLSQGFGAIRELKQIPEERERI